jgi:FtsP/CotA-like multicopper oxidase with cupredoxin domain
MMQLRVPALALLIAACNPLFAQLAPQPFLAPPTPHQVPQPGVLRTLAVLESNGSCDPAAEVSRNGNLVTVSIKVTEQENKMYNPGSSSGVNTDTVKLRSYGGCLSGPLIEMVPGSTLRVNLDNGLAKNDPTCPGGKDPADGSPGCFNTINLHFHGLHVSPAGNSDNVLLNIAPATKFQYEVNIPEDHPAGTFWYHAHRHGSTAMQVASGASGVLIIRGNRAYTGGTPGDVDTILKDGTGQPLAEQVFLFQQIPYACFSNATKKILTNSDGTWLCPSGQDGVVEDFDAQLGSPTVWDESGRFTSINGVVQPTLRNIAAGGIQRWRFVHGGIHDTVNLQIVPMVSNGTKAQLALKGIVAGTPAQQARTIAEVCPVTVPDTAKPVDLVPQFEIAADGLTRTQIRAIGVKATSVSGGMGSNFLQPGYRSDILVVFPHEGTYCVLNQAATPKERASAGAGGQGPNVTQLLATVTVSGGKPVPEDQLQNYVEQALYDNNKELPDAARKGLLTGDLMPWRGMPESDPAANASDPLKVGFYIGRLPSPPAKQTNPKGPFGFYINEKMYDPNRIDFTRQVGSTEDWLLTSYIEPHIFHIHVNPFEVMDVKYAPQGAAPQSIFGPHGECLVPPDSVGLQNQYCGMWHTYKDTVFVQNDFQVLIRTKYDRYIGEFVIHCHILDHEDGGMMTNIEIVPDLGAVGNGVGMAGLKHAVHNQDEGSSR